MKKILRGAVGPAFVVAIVQFLIEFVFPISAFAQTFEGEVRLMFVTIALSQMALLAGAGVYALFLRRRSRASLPACVVGGAAVGLLANLASQLAKSALLGLALVVALSQAPQVDSTLWVVLLIMIALSCPIAAIGGLIVGEIGGGLVGVLSAWRNGRSHH